MHQLLKLNVLLFFILFISLSTFSQHRISSGIVKSDTTVVAYCNIGVPNSPYGTVSKEDGSFAIELPEEFADSLIVFSSVGYKTKTLKNEVLVIAGAKDFILPEHSKLIMESIPNAELLIIPEATHYAPWEQALIFNKNVLKFFNTTDF